MEGGPIGSRVTMAASRLVMQEWSEGYLDILERSGMRTDALKGYVYDGRRQEMYSEEERGSIKIE